MIKIIHPTTFNTHIIAEPLAGLSPVCGVSISSCFSSSGIFATPQ
jgi:hypothetical protein